MSGTDYSAIRQAQLEVLRELVPTMLPEERFLAFEQNDPDFAAWADAAGGAFRFFDIQHGFDLGEEKYLDEATAAEAHAVLVLVSYPAVRQYAGRELEDIIDQDSEDIDRALGERGYHNYSEPGFGLHRCALDDTHTEERPAARILHMRFLLDYDRSMA